MTCSNGIGRENASPPNCDCGDEFFEAGVSDCAFCVKPCKTCNSLSQCVECAPREFSAGPPECGC